MAYLRSLSGQRSHISFESHRSSARISGDDAVQRFDMSVAYYAEEELTVLVRPILHLPNSSEKHLRGIPPIELVN
jgi:hypothetical protein